MSEIDNFIVKFKNLLNAGRNATLTIQTEAGKAEVNLYVYLGDVHLPPDQQHYHSQVYRNGPARQRRRNRRAEARRETSLAEEAAVEKSAVDEESADVTENGEPLNVPKENCTTEEVCDELCPDEDYEEVEKLTNENSDIFRVIVSDPTSNDEDLLDQLKERISLSMEIEKVKKKDKYFEIVKHVQLETEFKVFFKVKYKREVLNAIMKLGSDKIEVRKLPFSFRRTKPPPSFPSTQ